MSAPAAQRFTYAQYLERERASAEKHEWYDGEIFAMSGGKPVHALLAGRLIQVLMNALSPRGCDVYTSDLRVRIPATGLATYSDVTVICGDVEPDPEDTDAATNPVLLVEVLSPSTRDWDRTGKLAHYQQLPALQTYVLVDTQVQRVEVYRRVDGRWVHAWAGDSGSIEVLDGVSLDLASLYARTDVPPWRMRPPVLGEQAGGMATA